MYLLNGYISCNLLNSNNFQFRCIVPTDYCHNYSSSMLDFKKILPNLNIILSSENKFRPYVWWCCVVWWCRSCLLSPSQDIFSMFWGIASLQLKAGQTDDSTLNDMGELGVKKSVGATNGKQLAYNLPLNGYSWPKMGLKIAISGLKMAAKWPQLAYRWPQNSYS